MSLRLTASLLVAAGALAGPAASFAAGAPAPVVATLTAAPSVVPEAQPGLPDTVGADALPTWQLNGVVWSQAIVGRTVYVTGSFTQARPPGVAAGGAGSVAAANLFAFDLVTGNRVASFSHSLNGQGLVVRGSPDGSRVYVGGDFTTVDGITRGHLAAFSTADGSLVTSFAPNVGGQVRALAVSDTTVYAGGNFPSANGVALRSLAGFTTGGVLTSWQPVAGGASPVVWGMVLAPGGGSVVVGGSFETLAGVTARGMGAVSTTGAVLPWAATSRIRAYGTGAAITSVETDGTSVFGSAYAFRSTVGNFEGYFSADPAGGAINWVNDCLGDTYDTAAMGGVLYSVSHNHDCETIGEYSDTNPRNRWQKANAAPTTAQGTITRTDQYGWDFRGLPTARLLQWYPDLAFGSYTTSRQAAWSVEAASGYVVLGGEFPRVNGASQQCLTRFAMPSIGPRSSGPLVSAATTPTTLPLTDGVKVSWTAGWDRDDAVLSYELYRNGTAKIATLSADSTFWHQPSLTVLDPTPGTAPTYQVRVLDPDGNVQWSGVSAPDVDPALARTPYAAVVLGDAPTHYWTLDDPAGPAQDWAGGTSLAASGVTFGGTGVVGRAASSTGTSQLPAQASDQASGTVSVEAWFRTTASGGGRIIGRGSDNARPSLHRNDVVLYVDSRGRLAFAATAGRGSNTASAYTSVSSPGTVTNGAWHHAVATAGPTGTTLYLDGARVAGSSVATPLGDFAGYWRLLGDSTSSLPNRPTAEALAGAVDEAAVYPVVLDAATVLRHYRAGTGVPTNIAPTASFTTTVSGRVLGVDGSASSDSDGTVTAYAWDFGDGSTGTGVTASHTYAADGTYPVRLTVTDNGGLTGTTSRVVTVTTANALPTASFTATATGRSVAVDGSASSDSDGTVTAYAWDFGDGSTGTGVTASHTYAADGTYLVRLTVTDNGGATGTTTRSVTVSQPQGGATAVDTFTRTVAGGWGAADSGGSWSISGTASRWAVSGGAGRFTLATAGTGGSATLGAAPLTDAETQVVLATEQAPTGGGLYLSVMGRLVDPTTDYRAKVRLAADGSVTAYLTRMSNGTETVLTSSVVPGLTYAVGTRLVLRLQVTGTSPTTARTKVWAEGGVEPASWLLTTTDATSTHQAAGFPGVYFYLSSSATNAPVTVTVDDLWFGAPRP